MINKTSIQYRWVAFSTLLLAVVVAAACVPAGPPPANSQLDLVGTDWILVQINGQPPLAGTRLTLTFEEANLGGNTGCNHFGADYTASSDGKLLISDLVHTEIYCLEPEGVMAQEVLYLERLSQASSYRVVDERLEVLNPQGETILVFE